MEYLYRLKDECVLIKQCDRIMAYLSTHDELEKASRVGLIKLEHIYYKHDSLYEKTQQALKAKPEKLAELYFHSQPSEVVVQSLVDQVSQHCTLKLKVKAILLQSFHHAIHNRYFQAQDLVLKSQLAKTIAKQQIQNQIFYNRTAVQIGLAAYRLGLFEECNSVLSEICQNPKLKESLAQGQSNYSRLQEKTLEEEIEEKKRFMPPHLQLNLEQLDCVFMVTSMLQEVVNQVENKFTIAKKVISRNFRKLIDQYDSKGFQFVPSSNRDQIVAASRFLNKSQWQ